MNKIVNEQQVMNTLPILIITAVVVLLLALYYLDWKVTHEGFTTQTSSTTTGSLSFCPKSTTPFFDKSGDTVCCDGVVKGNICQGKPVCALSSGHKSLPTCQSFMKTYYQEKGKQICPSSLPNYFENPSKHISGCTDGQLNSDMNGPNLPNANVCTVYNTEEENQSKKDSCFNQKRLANIQCFGKDCTKTLSYQASSKSNLVSVEFTGLDGHRHTCYEKDSYIDYLNHSQPNWRKNMNFDPEKNSKMCDVAKKIYVDRTMDAKDAQ
jgi:hypothetical protein